MANNNSVMSGLMQMPDYTSQFDSADIAQNKVMSIFAYIGLLVLIPIFAAKGSKFARFHANQGLVLLIADAVCSLVLGILGMLPFIGIVFKITSWLLAPGFVALAVLGIVNVARNKAKALPIIGWIQILH